MLASTMGWCKGGSVPWGLAWDRPAGCLWPGGLEKVEAQQRDRRFPAAEGSQWPFQLRSLLALRSFGEFLSFPFPDGDPNKEDICGWSVREHYCGGCETIFRAVWEGKSPE